MFSFIVKITPKSEHFNSLKSEIQQVRDHTIKEKGCHLYLLHESAEDTNKCMYVYESFYSQADFDFHVQQEYTKKLLGVFETHLDNPVEIINLKHI